MEITQKSNLKNLNHMSIVQIKKLVDIAIIPSKGSNKSAGYDLSSVEEYILKPMEIKLFKTGISISIPPNQYGRIAPRSGLAYKNGIDTLAGVIDSDYRGEIGVILINFGKEEKHIKIGDKIAQIIFEFYNNVDFALVDDLDTTQRGEGGFGSTDKIYAGPAKFDETPSKMADLYRKLNYVETPKKTYEQAIKESQQDFKG